MTKSIFASKTIWVNLLAFVASVLTGLGINIGLDPATQGTIVMGIMAVVNMGLRSVTSKPLAVGQAVDD